MTSNGLPGCMDSASPMTYCQYAIPTLLLRLRSAALAGAVLTAACVRQSAPMTLDALAEEYVRLTLQFAQHRPNLAEGWLGDPEWKPGPRVPVATLRASLDELLLKAERGALAAVDETDAPRVAYLRGQLRALAHVASRLNGESTPFADEVRLAFGVPLPPIDREQAAAARKGLDAELGGEGRLRERYLDFTRHF
jgi:hypothetical protein